jgi:hypothetical protein
MHLLIATQPLNVFFKNKACIVIILENQNLLTHLSSGKCLFLSLLYTCFLLIVISKEPSRPGMPSTFASGTEQMKGI